MSESDVILVRALACSDALRLAVRNWNSNQSANRTIGLRVLNSHGVAIHVGGSAATRKTGELMLKEMASAGLITLGKVGRVKFPYVRLTARGEAYTRALAGLPDRAESRVLLQKAATLSKRDPVTLDELWIDEIAFNDGKGWGEGTWEETQRLGMVELELLPSISTGWIEAHSTFLAHVRYCVTQAGWKELDKPSKPPSVGKLPDFDDDACSLYRKAQDARFLELRESDPEETGEIGCVPLPVSHFGLPVQHDATVGV